MSTPRSEADVASPRTPALRATAALPADAYALLVRRAIFECDKWDPQVGDGAVLCRFALELDATARDELFARSERIARELARVEAELCGRPDLHALLGLPLACRLALSRRRPAITAARVVRLDFHPTQGGFALSEINSDVPGGYNEASGVTALFAEALGGALEPTGDPAAALASAVARRTAGSRRVAMVHATAYADDRQVMAYLGRLLSARGCEPVPAGPDALALERDGARLFGAPVGAIVRFFPAEWLPAVALRARWWRFFGGTSVPMANPATALLLQSKRWPLVLQHLTARADETMGALGRVVPARREHLEPGPRGAWVVKPALGRVGEHVGVPGVTSLAEWAEIARGVRTHPERWLAQERFVAEPVATPEGPRHACLGVYVIDGRAAGVYGRLARVARIDGRSEDVAILVRPPALVR